MSKILRADREAAQVSAHTSVGRRLSAASAELGPTFVKLAQMFSTRPDLLPEDILSELRGLQDHVPPFDHWWMVTQPKLLSSVLTSLLPCAIGSFLETSALSEWKNHEE